MLHNIRSKFVSNLICTL